MEIRLNISYIWNDYIGQLTKKYKNTNLWKWSDEVWDTEIRITIEHEYIYKPSRLMGTYIIRRIVKVKGIKIKGRSGEDI